MVTPGGRDGDIDVLETGPDQRSQLWHSRLARRNAVIVGVLVLGLLIGYVAGRQHTPTTTTTPAPPRVIATRTARPSQGGGPVIAQTDQTCSVQSGNRLQLGIEIINGSRTAVTLGRLSARLPLGGLRVVSRAIATCGQLGEAPGSFTTSSLGAGATTWLRLTVEVFEKCPAPIPVGFTITYRHDGARSAAYLPGFVDLGSVPYTGCRAQAPSSARASG